MEMMFALAIAPSKKYIYKTRHLADERVDDVIQGRECYFIIKIGLVKHGHVITRFNKRIM